MLTADMENQERPEMETMHPLVLAEVAEAADMLFETIVKKQATEELAALAA